MLIQVTAPPSAGTNIAITVNGREANAELKATTSGTLIVRLKDLQLGRNIIGAGVKGRPPAAQLAIYKGVVDATFAGDVKAARESAAYIGPAAGRNDPANWVEANFACR